MSDNIDFAQEQSDIFLQKAINSRPSFNGDSLKECILCGDDIPEKRRMIGNIKHCIEFKTHLERV